MIPLNDPSEKYKMITSLCVSLIALLFYGLAYYEVTEDMIKLKAGYFFTVKKIVFSEYEEIGLFTKRYYNQRHHRWVHTHYVYFSKKPRREEQWMDYEMPVEKGLTFLLYNETLHVCLTDTFRIELKGKLTQKDKNEK